MSSSYWDSLIRWWVEYWGRREQATPPSFHKEIITPPVNFLTGSFNADYLYIFPDTAAVITTPEGKRFVVTKGGYVDLVYGVYTLQYIDLHKHMDVLPPVRADSKDGLPVSLSVNLTWQVTPTNPTAVMGLDQPLGIFLTACSTAVKSFIRSHKHDELVLGLDGVRVEDAEISRYIVREVGQNQACRGFTIIDVRVTDRQGDPKLIEIQQARIVQEKNTLSEKEKLQQQRELVDQREDLIRRQAGTDRLQVEQQVNLAEIQAMFEARRAEIRYQIEVLSAEVERLRKLPERQHEQALEALKVREKLAEALIQFQAIQGFPRNMDEAQTLAEILRSLPDTTSSTSTPLTLLSSSLSSLMTPKINK